MRDERDDYYLTAENVLKGEDNNKFFFDLKYRAASVALPVLTFVSSWISAVALTLNGYRNRIELWLWTNPSFRIRSVDVISQKELTRKVLGRCKDYASSSKPGYSD